MHTNRWTASFVPVLALAAAFAVAGCNADGVLGGNNGRLRVVLSGDGAVAAASVAADSTPLLNGSDGDVSDDSHLSTWFASATVTLSSVLVRNLNGQLINVDFGLPVTVDVVQVEGGKQIVLPDALLPADTYDQVVIVITAVQGTTRDGTVVTIEPSGGGWTAVVPICPLVVADGATETVGITLNARSSFLWAGSHWGFQPRFRSQACASTGP